MNAKIEVPEASSRFDGWAAHFDDYAPVYEEAAFGNAGLAYVGDREITAIDRALRGVVPGDVLDAGAGTGRITRALTGFGWDVTALDISAEMLERIARTVPGTKTVGGALGEPLPFDDEAFDAVVSMRVLKYVADLDAAMREIARVVRPGGHVVLEFTNARSVARLGYRGAAIKFVTAQEARALFARHGVHVVSEHAGTRLPHAVFGVAKARRAAGAVARIDRLLGGDRTIAGARSFILHGQRA
jgi:ubiquinone/menaquinone biosynthesis C-methylase UbiE